MFENPRRGRQARNFTKNFPKILDLKSSSEQIFSEKCRWVPLSILQFCLHFALLLCSFNLSSVINFVAISAFLCGCFKAMSPVAILLKQGFAFAIFKPCLQTLER